MGSASMAAGFLLAVLTGSAAGQPGGGTFFSSSGLETFETLGAATSGAAGLTPSTGGIVAAPAPAPAFAVASAGAGFSVAAVFAGTVSAATVALSPACFVISGESSV